LGVRIGCCALAGESLAESVAETTIEPKRSITCADAFKQLWLKRGGLENLANIQ
tara:strand:- start:182 stop:343 length:162 start_codon:yes stop_codon:yes gene_type:complete